MNLLLGIRVYILHYGHVCTIRTINHFEQALTYGDTRAARSRFVYRLVVEREI
jgi:hypothetical protein